MKAIPVFMFHSVSLPGVLQPHGWLERITEPVDLFERMLETWRQRGIRTVGTQELEGFLHGKSDLPPRSVMLTFDDGYLDNWVAVYPLLRKYGQKAVVFVTTDFIDPRPVRRPNLDTGAESLEWQGYLSVTEMKEMVNSGVIEIQSHARTHTWYPTSPKIIDYYGPHWNISHPRCRYRFLWLNRNSKLKPFALQYLSKECVPWGTPIYEFAPALVARRFFPDDCIETELTEEVAARGGEAFFEQSDWRMLLDAKVAGFRRKYGERGRCESNEDRRRRVVGELKGSKEHLQDILGKPVTFLSPPQGGATEEIKSLAQEVGYALVTAPSAHRLRLNCSRDMDGWVYRCGTGFDIFGFASSMPVALASQRLAMARRQGSLAAAMITKGVGVLRTAARFLGE